MPQVGPGANWRVSAPDAPILFGNSALWRSKSPPQPSLGTVIADRRFSPPPAPAPASALERTTRRGWVVLLLNRLHYSSVVLSSFAFGLFLPFIRADLGLTYLQVGVLQGVWWGASALFLIPSGILLARFNPNRRVLAALALIAPCIFTQGLAGGFGTLLAARLMTVLIHAAMAPARPLLLRQWAAPGQYSTITAAGLSAHSTAMAAVLTFSPLLIVALGSWRTAYFLQGGLMAAHLLVWAALTRKPPASGPTESVAEPALTEQNRDAGRPARALLAYPHAWLLGGIMLCLSASWTTVLTFLPTLLEEEHGIAISGGSILFGFLYYALIPGGLLGGKIHRHIGNRRLMTLLPAALNTLFTVGALLSSSAVAAVAALTGLGLVWAFVPAMEVLPFEFRGIRPQQVSALAALTLTCSAIGFGGGPALAGAIAEATGSLLTGTLCIAGITGLGIAAAAAFPKNPAG